MRIEHVDLHEDLVLQADLLWPDSTWSQVLNAGLRLAIENGQPVDNEYTPGEFTLDGGTGWMDTDIVPIDLNDTATALLSDPEIREDLTDRINLAFADPAPIRPRNKH
jgi:hypothetical protein